MGCRACDHFSDSYSATRPTRNLRQKCLRVIDAKIDSWNSRAFDELVCDYNAVAKEYLGGDHRNKIYGQHHHTFLNLFLHCKLYEAVIFVCGWDLGGVVTAQ